jgi:hypothetical protein
MPTTASTLTIADAQREVRTTFLGGYPGQLVVAAIWLASAALATWSSHRAAIVTLAVGGACIFPLTQLVLRLMSRPASLPKGHPMNALAGRLRSSSRSAFPSLPRLRSIGTTGSTPRS